MPHTFIWRTACGTEMLHSGDALTVDDHGPTHPDGPRRDVGALARCSHRARVLVVSAESSQARLTDFTIPADL
jgi:hypothetical protein